MQYRFNAEIEKTVDVKYLSIRQIKLLQITLPSSMVSTNDLYVRNN